MTDAKVMLESKINFLVPVDFQLRYLIAVIKQRLIKFIKQINMSQVDFCFRASAILHGAAIEQAKGAGVVFVPYPLS